MNTEKRNCQNCKTQFTIESDDFDFYKKMQVPPPTFCPECRFVRRFLARNERALFKRKCDLCQQDKILGYPPDCGFPVYCYQCWISDKWEAEEYARDYDFSKPFFTQFMELSHTVPHMGIIQQGNVVRSEYTHRASDNKDCYLIFGANENEHCSYGSNIWFSKDSMDCYDIHRCERCYECTDCTGCNGVKYSRECDSCANSAFLLNCRSCTDCFGCVNLRGKNNCWFNKQLSKEEYTKRMAEIDLSSAAVVASYHEQLKKFAKGFIVPSIVEHHSVNVSGNWIENSKNAHIAYASSNIEDGKYLFGINSGKDIMDHTFWSMNSELTYECVNVGRQCGSVAFVNQCWDQLLRSQYCTNCHSSSDLFGCYGLKHKQYCIFNKQYSKEEYETLRAKIIAHMNTMPYVDKMGRTYKYGEFFPSEILPFAYNQTIAQEHFPITKEKALAQGFRWQEPETKNYKVTLSGFEIPDKIENVSNNITKEVLGCEHAQKCNQMCTAAFRITPDELAFYRYNHIPIPRLCSNCRHFERLAMRPPMRLWHRKCQCGGQSSMISNYKNTAMHFHGNAPCPNEFETAYAPEHSEIVYCEQCYQAEVV